MHYLLRKPTIILFGILSMFIIFSKNNLAQEITFIPESTNLSDTVGAEIVFNIELQNVSQEEQTVFIVRTINILPDEWESSLCFDFCFASFIDSIATTEDFFSEPLDPGEIREVSLHVFTLENPGAANVQLQAGTFNNPQDRITIDFVASAIVSSVDFEQQHLTDYYLAQNFPNPFNPSTQINFGLKREGYVSIKLFDILGREVAEIVNEFLPAGIYTFPFDAESAGGGLSSGVYFYKITSNDFVQTRKMILEK